MHPTANTHTHAAFIALHLLLRTPCDVIVIFHIYSVAIMYSARHSELNDGAIWKLKKFHRKVRGIYSINSYFGVAPESVIIFILFSALFCRDAHGIRITTYTQVRLRIYLIKKLHTLIAFRWMNYGVFPISKLNREK